MFEAVSDFEADLAVYTNAPYAILTDCCTHAIELALMHDNIKRTRFTPYTYLSVPMTMHKLGIVYEFLPEDQQTWVGEYQFLGTRIWDSARRLEHNMYRPGTIQCLSFGWGKPMYAGRGGAILTDDEQVYEHLRCARSDGRDLDAWQHWPDQQVFSQGYHYRCTIEEAERCGTALEEYRGPLGTASTSPHFVAYPDLRKLTIL